MTEQEARGTIESYENTFGKELRRRTFRTWNDWAKAEQEFTPKDGSLQYVIEVLVCDERIDLFLSFRPTMPANKFPTSKWHRRQRKSFVTWNSSFRLRSIWTKSNGPLKHQANEKFNRRYNRNSKRTFPVRRPYSYKMTYVERLDVTRRTTTLNSVLVQANSDSVEYRLTLTVDGITSVSLSRPRCPIGSFVQAFGHC